MLERSLVDLVAPQESRNFNYFPGFPIRHQVAESGTLADHNVEELAEPAELDNKSPCRLLR